MNIKRCWRWFGGFVVLACSAQAAHAVVVGSKRFTESYILGEIVCQTWVAAGQPCEHKQGLGNTGILEQALKSGAVDVYPEYTGTIVRELLKREGPADLAQINAWLAERGLKAVVPLGFNNTYALAMREAQAQQLGVRTISDLARLPPAALKPGLSHEFLVRADGWPALQRAYGLAALGSATGIDHGIAYEALKGGQVDLIDVYSTDAKIGRYGLRVLLDDRGHFPKYDAVLLMRAAIDERALLGLAGRIDEARMIALNAEVELDGKTFADAARGFVQRTGTAPARQDFMARLLAPDLARLTGQHLLLVFASVAIATLIAVPMGVLAWRHRRWGAVLLAAAGVLQTVPSLALLAFLIALVGTIGFVPALLALVVYALLPIVCNTHAGLAGVDGGLRMAARALALSEAQCLRLVELPLALPMIWAGIKTAAVINVGTATVAAFIGAGGYGERIVAGLAVNDNTAMLAGAVPAAVLALGVQGLFAWLERRSRRPR